MLKRVITGACILALLVPIVIFSGIIVLPITIAIISLISAYEIAKCMKMNVKHQITIPIYLCAIVFPFLMRYMNSFVSVAMIGFICAVFYLIYLFVLIITSHGKLNFSEISAFFAIETYIITALNSVIYIRDFDDNGKFIIVLIFVGAWITDTFAYFTGVLIGKHKLIEDVSPKKTIEGSIGGIFFCALAYVLFGIIVDTFFGGNSNRLLLAISGILMSVISQVGDLIMSVIKRYYGVKDYGKIFPGHGGMLDRFDSILAVSIGLACVCVFARLTGLTLM